MVVPEPRPAATVVLLRDRDGHLEVFMMEPIVQDVIKVKAFDPTAKVIKFSATKLGGETGFDDFENDLTFSDNEPTEFKFNTKTAERFKNGTN